MGIKFNNNTMALKKKKIDKLKKNNNSSINLKLYVQYRYLSLYN